MKFSLKWKYILPVFLSASAQFCTRTPQLCAGRASDDSECDIMKHQTISSSNYGTLLPTLEYLPNFILLNPFITGYIIDLVGVVNMMLFLNPILLVGQLFYMIGYFKGELLTLTFGYFFMTIVLDSLRMAQIVYLANTFIPKHSTLPKGGKDTSVFSRLALYTIIVTVVFDRLPSAFSHPTAVILGCVLAAMGCVLAYVISRSSYSAKNTEVFMTGESLSRNNIDQAPLLGGPCCLPRRARAGDTYSPK